MERVNRYLASRLRIAFLLLGFMPSLALGSDYNFSAGGESGSNSKCYLGGSVRPLDASGSKQGFQAMENRLRLNFDADDPQSCERYIKSYCQNNIIGRGDVPVKLTGYFRPARTIATEADRKPTHTYEITQNCKLIVE